MTIPELTPSTIITINFSRLLSRLDQKLSFTTPKDPASTPSPLEITKITAHNLEYARRLLLELEHESGNVRNAQEREKALAKLGEQKVVVRKLNEKLHLSAQEVEVGEDDTDEEIEVVDADKENYLPTVPKVPSSAPMEREEDDPRADYPPSTQSTLRNRFQTQQERAALFSQEGDSADGEKNLDVQHHKQENLTKDMLSFARALKENSIRFGRELDKEKGLLGLASEGLDKNARGIEGAGRKMDLLTKNENVNFMWLFLCSLFCSLHRNCVVEYMEHVLNQSICSKTGFRFPVFDTLSPWGLVIFGIRVRVIYLPKVSRPSWSREGSNLLDLLVIIILMSRKIYRELSGLECIFDSVCLRSGYVVCRPYFQ